ncbi:MAG: hypothetical protein ACLGI3_15940, partial [Actinomycetes bacterium]
CALLGLGGIDEALVELLPTSWRIAAAAGAVVFLGAAARLLRRPVSLRVGPAGIDAARLVGPRRRLRWDQMREVVVCPRPSGRLLALYRHGRRSLAVAVAEDRVSGSMDEVLASFRGAAVPIRVEVPTWTVGPRMRWAARWGKRSALAVGAAGFAAVLPLPGYYASLPGDVVPASRSLRPPEVDERSRGVHMVTAHLRPANLVALLVTRWEPAAVVGTRSEILGTAPRAVRNETDRQITAGAAKEAVVAAWRFAGVPVTLDGAGVELVSVPSSLQPLLRPEDVVVAVAGEPTTTLWTFREVAARHRLSAVRLTLRRGAVHLEVEVGPDWMSSGGEPVFV